MVLRLMSEDPAADAPFEGVATWCRDGESGTKCSGGDAVPTGPLRSGE